MGQVIGVVVVVVQFADVWAVNKSFGLGNSLLQDKKIFLAKAVEVAVEGGKSAKALEYSTFDFEHKEIENWIVTYLEDVATKVFEGSSHKVH